MRRYQFPRVVDGFLVPATPEPLVTFTVSGSAEFQEREIGERWLPHHVQPNDIFVTGSKTPYELRWRSAEGEEMDVLQIHLAIEQCQAAFQRVHRERSNEVEVADFYGQDITLGHLCQACANLLSEHTPGESMRIASFAETLAVYVAEKYVAGKSHAPRFGGGLPVGRMRKVEGYVQEHLAEDISTETLAAIAELSPFHFSRVFKQSTGMTPLKFVTRERMLKAQQLIRESSHSLLDIGLEVGYTSPSHFAEVFRRNVGVTPMEFRKAS